MALPILTALLLVMAMLTGGGSQDRGWGDALTQLLAWPVLLLAADVVARLVVLPGEVPVGVVAAILGGPAFVMIVRRPRIEAL